MFSHLIGNIKPPDHPKYRDAVKDRARRMWLAKQARQRDAAYNAWFHDGEIMQRDMFGNWKVTE